MGEQRKALISSTVRDLSEHRREVQEACLRQHVFPLLMEHLPAAPADAVRESMRLVEEADLYIGLVAHRYGYVDPATGLSITELEYRRAGERGLPRLMFVMSEEHLLRASDVETGPGAEKLARFKERVLAEQVAAYFSSKEDLRAQVINSLSHLPARDEIQLHFVSDIPAPPKTYVAHPYTLLQTDDLVGRRSELSQLSDWVARPDSRLYGAPVLSLVAIGGMGKSALAWKWFQDIAPQEVKPLAGRLWWSFYESDATFENFVIRALAYVAGLPRARVQAMTPAEREERLLNLLAQHPFLLALDGLERILIAYARLDAATLRDEEVEDPAATGQLGPPPSAEGREPSARSLLRLRKTADPRAGSFLRKLAQIEATRTLISTRLHPAELETDTGVPVPGTRVVEVAGLTDDDALALWRRFGVSGSRNTLQPLFESFGNYPLLIRALAGEVSRYRDAPGDFDRWLTDHPDFNPFGLPLTMRNSHVLAFALQGIDRNVRKVLVTLAGFRMPAGYRTLRSLLVGADKLFEADSGLDMALAELEDRGLLGWDRRSNRYDLHPVVRGVTWHRLGRVGRRIIYENLEAHFQSLPSPRDDEVRSLDDLTAAIELYSILVGLERYDDAYAVFKAFLDKPVLVQLSRCREAADWLEQLFVGGLTEPPLLAQEKDRESAIRNLAYAYHFSGQPRLSAQMWVRAGSPDDEALALLQLGELRRAVVQAERAIASSSSGIRQRNLAQVLSVCGQDQAAERSFSKALAKLPKRQEVDEHLAYLHVRIARHALVLGDLARAAFHVERAAEAAHTTGLERPLIMVLNVQGRLMLRWGRLDAARERLTHALRRARSIHYVAAELDALIDLAELHRSCGDEGACRETLADLLDLAERGPFRLARAEGSIVLAQLELSLGHPAEAIAAAQCAYHASWCDGPPFAFHWGLETSRAVLTELGAEESQEGVL